MTSAVILAAGFGARLRPITDTRPKCMVSLAGRSLLDRQLEVFRDCGIDDVSIVLGHAPESVDPAVYPLRRFMNEEYRSTNMVASLMRASALFDGTRDVLVSYGDIVYERRVLESVLANRHEISVAVDRRWRDLWELRMDDPLSDAETMRIASNGRIEELGKKPKSYDDVQGQYIGLFRVAARVAPKVVEFHHRLPPEGPYDGRDRSNMFMTSFIQALIDAGFDVGAAFIDGGWLEIDQLADLERYEGLAGKGTLSGYYDDRL
ncbi:phosphocholine cytidylyltransferase family protein [Bradyrhizobium sp. JYMT SZCCT0180]|uniref:phosphocholine cytidylyltransferase family protein n=1 Tax=Bradyrhizobium sp. JYMT SZCCT0180 TaxID=2807666 RepID=UPI001BA80848|nr:phosphocholine cytidylyltransferase family protein [Bradyrhizobium sp. JYMT SZCCT0180]MBR1214328.1 phosphocholine cytidylyltransferase family protein [Bradyrhizobium sp. JYMT SZCCT0180]